MKCKCGNPMQREIRPERYVCLICGRSEWLQFKMVDMAQHTPKGAANGKDV